VAAVARPFLRTAAPLLLVLSPAMALSAAVLWWTRRQKPEQRWSTTRQTCARRSPFAALYMLVRRAA